MAQAYIIDDDVTQEVQKEWNKNLKSLRIWFFVMGALLLVGGVVFLIWPIESAVALAVIAAIMLIVFGVFQIVEYCTMMPVIRSGALLLCGVLNIILGIMLLSSSPDVMVATFGVVFAITMLMMGIECLTIASRFKAIGISGRGWLIADGILGILCGVGFLFVPVVGATFTTILVGIYMIVAGAALIIDGFQAKALKAK